MKISYNWLKEFIKTELPTTEVARLLTNCGLEVESIENYESIKGGLEGLVIGEVKTKEKHPDADRLSITTVDTGKENLLNIVCGASNVAIGQKIVVATAGATIYPTQGEPFEIKKSKIRGTISEGMICAEDEIGLGASHEGIMVLDSNAVIGTPARDYFNIQSDSVFEIGLTPNRADAASHLGVARDLAAVISIEAKKFFQIQLPSVGNFQIDNTDKKIEVIIEDTIACPRYSGITISNIKIKESPDWLKSRLKSIGLKPINNVVDITNFVLHEIGQPLHAFDADKITGNKIIVKKLPAKTKFKTLDQVDRELSANDLIISNAEKAMCIAGVFGGAESGITETTTTIFLESAYFDPIHIRKTSKYHGLKTDASFRYERGTDPNITVYALKRAAVLIKEVAGGKISSEIIDIYPRPIENFKISFSYENSSKLIGKNIDKENIKNILKSLNIDIIKENNEGLLLSVPPYKVDVHREVDVVEEILRIHGYNNIEIPLAVRSSISYAPKPDVEKIQNIISDLLSSNGFNEIMTNSLTKSQYYNQVEDQVTVLNPLSNELNAMRKTLLYGGLEAVVYNQNRKNLDLKLYEFGKTYHSWRTQANGTNPTKQFLETNHLALFVCGSKEPESWNTAKKQIDFYDLKANVKAIIDRLGIQNIKNDVFNNELISEGLLYSSNKKPIVVFGKVTKTILKNFDLKQEIYHADFNWNNILELIKDISIQYKEVPKFPEVRRDLALLIDKSIKYEQLEQLAYQVEKHLLKKVSLFDVYEGDKIGAGKKSYAMSFILQDDKATLSDNQIDKVMEKLIKTYQEKTGAVIR